MTSRADEIQKLIADIDNLLTSGGKRLSKLLSGQAQEPKEVLQRIREFLVSLQISESSESLNYNQPSEQVLSPLLAKFVDQGHNQSSRAQTELNQEQISAGAEQLKSEFAKLIQPLQAELELLLQDRATLVQEIRQLEQRRSQSYSLAQQLANQDQTISEFLQVLMSRLVPSLTPHIANSSSSSEISNSANPELISSTTQPLLESPERVEWLTQLARELDQRLLSLDGTVNAVFPALERNINTYHDSLSQALARMHSKGVQSEQLMSSFINNLTQYLPQQSLSLSVADVANSTEVAPQQTTEAMAIPAESDNTSVTDDLDNMLLQLGLGPSPASAIPTESEPDSFNLIGDEVDLLYASLFGTDNIATPNVEVAQNIDTSESAVLNIAESPSTSPTSSQQQTDPLPSQPETVVLDLSNADPQPASEEPTNSSADLQELLFFAEDTDLASPMGFFTLLQEEVSATNSLPGELSTQPGSDDTISNLTDLFAESEVKQQALEVPTSVEKATEVTATSAVMIRDVEPERPLDNYITASPQENLLLLEENQATAVPEISLDEEQLQQLDRDLANFDRQLNSEPQTATNLASEISETLPTVSLEVKPLSPEISRKNFAIAEHESTVTVSPAEVDLDPSPKTEKKKETTTLVPENSLPANSHPVNNTETGLNLVDAVWYLGIDLGTTGISASLLNSSTSVVYPIYWSTAKQPGSTSFQQSFRLPAEVYLPIASVPHGESESIEAQEQIAPAAVAQEKVPNHSVSTAASTKVSSQTNNLYSAQLKPYLQVAIPYKSEQEKWEPVLQLNEFSAGPLIWVVRSLSKLLLTLKRDRTSTTPGLMAAAVGINESDFLKIINKIAGVICTCPSSWSEQYRFNVREALLKSKLIQHPGQAFFVEEAIASLLPEIDGAKGETVKLSTNEGLRPAKTSEHSLLGNTLVINIGATATEMVLVDVPKNLQQLTHNDFMLHSFAYASKGIEQDIICQLLLPPKSRQSRSEPQGDKTTTSSNPRHWQPSIPGLDQMQWQSLGLEELQLPRVGEPDIMARIRLQQRLESSLLGQAILDAGLALKLILQHQETFTLEVADQRWILRRRDLESQVFIPFVRRLNRELNKLLVARGIPTEAINQAILTGGVAMIATVNRWLRQKLPNAKIIQDLYLGENGAPNCSRVAYGVAMLPLHPHVLEIPRQQYTDYFLFTELLRLLPDRPLSFNEVIQLFEGRGINTRTCQQRLLAFLEGELPAGLIPLATDSAWLTQSSQENPDYQAIATAPLFEKQGSLTYRPNFQQLLSLRRYLDAIKASSQQSLEEPYTVNFILDTHY